MSYQLIHLIEKFSQARLLVIGDIMLDRFMKGSVERISPEAPVPIFKQVSEKLMLGGAGNVIANLSALGCHPYFVSVIGQDTNGKILSQYLKDLKVDNFLLQTKKYPTITKTRLIANNNHLLRCDQEVLIQLTESEENTLLSHIRKQINNVDLVLLSDYGKGLFTPYFTQSIIQISRSMNKPVFVDPKGIDYSKYRGATLIKPNRKELELATNHNFTISSPDFLGQVKEVTQQLLNQIEVEQSIVTLSDKGMLFVSSSSQENPIYLETFAREVFDVSGAGDTSLSVLGLSISVGATISQAMELANLASGIVVGKIGTATVTPDELKEAIQIKYQLNRPLLERKVVSLDELLLAVKQLREQGKKVGFSNGYFDILTLTQLKSLQQAKKTCDFLIVGINTDYSIQQQRGEKPHQDEQTRSQIVAALDCVDLVVLTNEDSTHNILNLLSTIKPDVVAITGYNHIQDSELDYITSYGGSILEVQDNL